MSLSILKTPRKIQFTCPSQRQGDVRDMEGNQAISMLAAFLLRLKRQIWSDFMCAPVANFIYTWLRKAACCIDKLHCSICRYSNHVAPRLMLFNIPVKDVYILDISAGLQQHTANLSSLLFPVVSPNIRRTWYHNTPFKTSLQKCFPFWEEVHCSGYPFEIYSALKEKSLLQNKTTIMLLHPTFSCSFCFQTSLCFTLVSKL